jgi:hypothetical protein
MGPDEIKTSMSKALDVGVTIESNIEEGYDNALARAWSYSEQDRSDASETKSPPGQNRSPSRRSWRWDGDVQQQERASRSGQEQYATCDRVEELQRSLTAEVAFVAAMHMSISDEVAELRDQDVHQVGGKQWATCDMVEDKFEDIKRLLTAEVAAMKLSAGLNAESDGAERRCKSSSVNGACDQLGDYTTGSMVHVQAPLETHVTTTRVFPTQSIQRLEELTEEMAQLRAEVTTLREALVAELLTPSQTPTRSSTPTQGGANAHLDDPAEAAETVRSTQQMASGKDELTSNSSNDSNDEAFEPPQSLAAFCIEEAMAPLGPTWNGVVATLQMVLLTFFQYILAHTFFDTAWLQYTLYNTQTDFYVEWPDPHEFYIMRPCPECRVPSGLDRTFEFGCDGPDGRQAGSCRIKSRLSVLASAAAIILLVAGPLFMDDCQTTCCKLPIDYLLFDDRLVDFARRQPRWRAFAVLLWRLATVLIFQFCWAVRVLLVPGFCLSGTTMVLNQADSALDVVLNSVAIGFV